jgi:translation initiation factor IF-3
MRLVDEQGQQLGVFTKDQALSMAQEKGIDLILITDKTTPVICKLIDYGKYLYQLKKGEKKTKTSQVKGIRLNFNISLHDMETKAKQSKKFLDGGDRVRVDMILRGRQKAFNELATEKINKFVEIVSSYIAIETDQGLKKDPRGLSLIIKKGKNEIKNETLPDKKV